MIDMATWCPNCGRKCREVVDKATGAISHLCPQCGWDSATDPHEDYDEGKDAREGGDGG